MSSMAECPNHGGLCADLKHLEHEVDDHEHRVRTVEARGERHEQQIGTLADTSKAHGERLTKIETGDRRIAARAAIWTSAASLLGSTLVALIAAWAAPRGGAP